MTKEEILMSPEIWGAIVGAIIGAGLATTSGVYLSNRQIKTSKKNTKEVFVSIIEDDLTNAIPLYDRIKEIGKNEKYVNFEALNEIRYSRRIYEKYIEHVALIESHSLRKRIFDYYIKSSALITKLETLQNVIYACDRAIKDVKRHILIDNKGVELSEDALKPIVKDDQEKMKSSFEMIQAEIGNLDNFKIEAQLILQELRSSKKIK